MHQEVQCFYKQYFFLEGPSYEVIIVGDRNKSNNLIKLIQKNNNPNKVIIYNNDDKTKLFKFLKYYNSGPNGDPLAYVCQNYSCQLPSDDINKIKNMLK